MGKRHYLSKTKEYRIWVNVRVHNNDVSKEWNESPVEFISYVRRLANCGARGYTLSKIEESLGYREGNVHFIKRSVRNARRKYNKYVGIRQRGGRFVARITVNRAEINIGSAETQEEALAIRNQYIIDNRLPHRIQ